MKTCKTLIAAVVGLFVFGSAQAEPVAGMQQGMHILDASRVDVFEVPFYGEERAEVRIVGDGDSDLDLFIYDENGYEICKSVKGGDVEICTFTPRWTGNFRIEVRNHGDRDSIYIIRAS